MKPVSQERSDQNLISKFWGRVFVHISIRTGPGHRSVWAGVELLSLSGLLIRLLADREALRPVLCDRCTRTLENPSWAETWQGLGYFPVHLILEALAVTNL